MTRRSVSYRSTLRGLRKQESMNRKGRTEFLMRYAATPRHHEFHTDCSRESTYKDVSAQMDNPVLVI